MFQKRVGSLRARFGGGLHVDAKLSTMTDEGGVAAPATCDPDIDENGVDLAQIRALLDLEPAERLLRMTEFMNSLLEIRALNGTRGSG